MTRNKSLGAHILEFGFNGIGYTLIKYKGNCAVPDIPEEYDDGVNGKRKVTSIGVSAFANNSVIKAVTVPSGVTEIEDEAFYGCSSLENVTLSDGIKKIGEFAFFDCAPNMNVIYNGAIAKWCDIDGLGNVATAKPNLIIGGYRVAGDLIIPDGVKRIAWGAFSGQKELTSVYLPDSVTSVEESAFNGCSSLAKIRLSANLQEIGRHAFCDCRSLNEISVPEKVTSIGAWAFKGCSSLTNITLHSGVTHVGSRAFYGCAYLSVNCEAESKPNGWDDEWNISSRPVIWLVAPAAGQTENA